MIQCPNPTCQANNDPGRAVCQVCQTPLIRRFLWVANSDLSGYSPGTLLAERFQVWAPHLLLDIQPGRYWSALPEVPPAVVPYLRLSAWPLHIPKPFTVLSLPSQPPLLLLEDAPLATQPGDNGQLTVQLLPTLISQWAQANPLRQLNWLRQMSLLWPAFEEERVEASLLVPEFLRVDGSVLRLLALQEVGKNQPTLADLGRQWQTLAASAHPAIREYLQGLAGHLCDRTQKQDITAVEHQLEQAITLLFQGQPVRLETVTLTDQGPSRARNEDACYPSSGTVTQGLINGPGQPAPGGLPAGLSPLVIVCDGIGGHESGNVASQLAIQTLQQQLATLLQQPHLSPTTVAAQLRQAALVANDAIAQRNDQEHRQERERMGTTLVVALIYPPYLYIAHLGDSRAYRISADTCCQITLDDDVAARETRLGYALYRDALQYPNAGSLVQALGIGESSHLYPTLHHFLLDDDSLFLICSDGLSDFERIDTFWLQTVRPAVLGQVPLAQVGQQLVNLANGYNGHDNVTVGLISLAPQPVKAFGSLPATLPAQPDAVGALPAAPSLDPAATRLVEQPTVLQAPARRQRRGAGLWWVGVGAIATALGALLWWLRPLEAVQPFQSLQLSRFTITPRLTPGSPTSPAMTVGSFWQVQATPTGSGAGARPLTLQVGAEPRVAPSPAGQNAPLIPAGSILKIVSRRTTPDKAQWVHLQVCSIPSGMSLSQAPQETDLGAPATPASGPATALTERLSQPGEEGWLLEPQLTAAARAIPGVTPTQKGVCS